jgi:uncharacterized protein YciI
MTVFGMLPALALVLFLQGSSASSGTAAPAPPYKMITYHLVMLKKGPSAATAGTPEGQKVLKEHIAHLYTHAADGANMAAGPLLDGGDIQGLLIIKAATLERARAIEAADPAVKAGIFTIDAASFMSPDGWFGKWAEFGKFETVYFGFLNSGPNRGHDAATAERLQAEHLAYMDGQSKEGKLILAGPFVGGGTRRGVVVYRVANAEEARSRAEGDPMVKAGRLAVELHPWQVPQGALPAR